MIAEALVVVNASASGTGDADRLLADVGALASSSGSSAVGTITGSEAELHDVLAGANGRRVILVGGDGSLAAAVNAPIARLPQLALVPAGRANNIARALGVPLHRRAAVHAAVTAPCRPLDVLRVESADRVLFAVEAVSAGFQAEARASYGATNSADLRQGVGALLRGVRRYEPYEISVRTADGPVFAGQAAQLFLANLPYFGFGFRVNPAAVTGDGLMEALVLEATDRRALVRLLAAAYRGRHLGRPGVTWTRTRQATIDSELPLVADAIPLGTGTASVRVQPGRLALAAPEDGRAR